MTTTTLPVSNSSPQVLAILLGALMILILAATIALGAVAISAPVAPVQPMTNQANSDDATPLSGVLEFAD